MIRPLLDTIELDFDYMMEVLLGKVIPDRALFAEFYIDEEIKQFIIENHFNEQYWPSPVSMMYSARSKMTDSNEKETAYKRYYKQIVNFYSRMGYSLFADLNFLFDFESLNSFEVKSSDTAHFGREERHWAIEGSGLIKSWEDFDNFPWEKARDLVTEYEGHLNYIATILPDGMKIGAVTAIFEEVLEWILGYQGFFYLLYDEPDLVEAVFQNVGEIMFSFCEVAVQMDSVGCIWHGDDLGFKSGPFVSPEVLDKLVFPWLKKYASLSHNYNKTFILHSCGNKDLIMDKLINEVKIDAIHSFEDNSCSVLEYKKIWGKKVGIIGGVDVDKLARLEEDSLRIYMKKILNTCMQNGRYVFGSGNSICNYIPINNYLAMIDEGMKWTG